MSTLDEVKGLIEDQGTTIKARFAAIERDMRLIEAKAGRPPAVGGGEQLSPEQTAHKEAFARFLRKGDDAGLEELQRKAMNTGTDPDGGYMVVPEMDRFIDRIAETVSPMYRIANVVTIGTNKYEKLVKTSGMAMRRVAEGATGGETTEPKYAKLTIEVHTGECEPWVHNETLEDAFANLEQDLAGEAGIAFAEGAGSEFISGDGVGKARGILEYTKIANASYAWGKIGYVVTTASAAFPTASTSVNSADPLINLVHALKTKWRAGASWLMNSNTAGTVRKLKDADGRHIWSDSLVNGQPPQLLGYPVAIDDNMPDVGAAAYAIAFGNFKRGYTIVNRTGTTLIRDPYTAKGTTKFNFRRRFGGGIYNFEAIKLMKFATS